MSSEYVCSHAYLIAARDDDGQSVRTVIFPDKGKALILAADAAEVGAPDDRLLVELLGAATASAIWQQCAWLGLLGQDRQDQSNIGPGNTELLLHQALARLARLIIDPAVEEAESAAA